MLDWWNSGAALIDPDNVVVEEWFEQIAKRARHDARSQRATVRSHFKGRGVGL